MNTQTLTGLVLTKKQLLGKDQLVIFFTQEQGKVACIAKNIRGSKSNRSAATQSGNLVTCYIGEFKSTRILKQTTIISGFSALKDSYEAIQSMYGLLYCLNTLLPEDEPEPVVYKHTLQFFKQVSKQPTKAVSYLFSTLSLVLNELGYLAPETPAAIAGTIDEIIGRTSPLHDIISAYGRAYLTV